MGEETKGIKNGNMEEVDLKDKRLNRFPFKRGILPFIGKRADAKDEDSGKLKEPILQVIKDNYEVEIFQDVKPGKVTVQRGEEEVEIIIPKSKILSHDWGNESIRGWIVDVREGVALPTDTEHDSLEFKRSIDAMQTNYKNYHAQEIRAKWDSYIKLIVYIGVVIAILIFIAGAFGVDVISLLGLEKTINIPPPPVEQAANLPP